MCVEQTGASWGGARDVHQRWLNTPLSPSNFLYHANGAAMPVLLINLSAAGGWEALLADAQKAIKRGAAGGDGERQIKGWTNQRRELWGNKHMVSEMMMVLLRKNESDNRQVNWNWCENTKQVWRDRSHKNLNSVIIYSPSCCSESLQLSLFSFNIK